MSTLDTLDIVGATLALPEQVASAAAALGDGVAGLPDGPLSNVLVVGMGGSGIAGDVLAAVAGPVCAVPIVVHKDYELPGFVGSDTLLLAVSASGSTEETLHVATEAVRAGARLVAVSQGGALAELAGTAGAPHIPVPAEIVMPRTGLGALAVPLLLVLEQLGLCPGAERGRAGGGQPAAPPARCARPARQRGRGAGPQDRPHDPPRLRRRRAGRGRGPAVEGPVQRERQGAGLRQPGARAVPQRGRRVGPAR